MSFAFRSDTDMTVTAVGNGLTDTQSQSCTLYEIIQLHEPFKHTRLFLLGDTGTCILAIEQQSIGLSLFIEGHSALIAIAHLDMALMRILHGIRREIREDLLHTSLVKGRHIVVIGIILDKLHPRLLHTLGEGLTDIIEDSDEIHLLGFDGQGLSHIRGLEDIIDETHQHVTVVTDDPDKLHTLLVGIDHGQQVTEAHDGIQWRADLVRHIRQEGTLHLTGVLGTGGLFLQLLLGHDQFGDVTRHTEVTDLMTILVEGGDATHGMPRRLLVVVHATKASCCSDYSGSDESR